MKRGTPKSGKELSLTLKKGHYFEKIIAKNILKKEKFTILPLGSLYERLMTVRTGKQTNNSKNLEKLWDLLAAFGFDKTIRIQFFDYFCKKGIKYYLIDAKLKQFTNQEYWIDRISVSANQVLCFNKIPKNTKLQTKILLGLEKNGRLFYRFFDWSDFIISQKYDPLKKQGTTIKCKTSIKSLEFYPYNP